MVYFEALTPIVNDKRQFAGFTKMLPGSTSTPVLLKWLGNTVSLPWGHPPRGVDDARA